MSEAESITREAEETPGLFDEFILNDEFETCYSHLKRAIKKHIPMLELD